MMWQISLATPAAFLSLVFTLKQMMMKREAVDFKQPWLNTLIVVHNLALSCVSLVMAVMFTYSMSEVGWHGVFCGGVGFTPVASLAMYMYYYSKYWELVDTVILVLKKKPTSYLHLWHHSVMVPLSYLWIDGTWHLAFIGAWMNTIIHVAMYGYWGFNALNGFRPWWRRLITVGQITQFFAVFILIFVQLAVWPTDTPCSGSQFTRISSQLVNVTFLVFFINFFVQDGRKTPAQRK